MFAESVGVHVAQLLSYYQMPIDLRIVLVCFW